MLDWAARHEIAVVGVAHHRKPPPRASIADHDVEVLGATGLVGLARIVLHITRDPRAPQTRRLTFAKSNIESPPLPTTADENEQAWWTCDWLLDRMVVDLGGGVFAPRLTWRLATWTTEACATAGPTTEEVAAWIVEHAGRAGKVTKKELVEAFARKTGRAAGGSVRAMINDGIDWLVEQGRARLDDSCKPHRLYLVEPASGG